MFTMFNLPDDPIIACIERTGYPPWIKERLDRYGKDDEEDMEEDSIDRLD